MPEKQEKHRKKNKQTKKRVCRMSTMERSEDKMCRERSDGLSSTKRLCHGSQCLMDMFSTCQRRLPGKCCLSEGRKDAWGDR